MNHDIFVLLCMIFLHILDDFHLQGILAKMKQREWWKRQEGYDELYAHDWIPALVLHSFSWTFMIMLPLAMNSGEPIGMAFLGIFIGNMIVHAIVDHCKANRRTIPLTVDQSIHIVQIIATYVALI